MTRVRRKRDKRKRVKMKVHSFDLLICIRCHDYSDLVLDTIDSVLSNVDPDTCKLVCAIDNDNRELGRRLATAIGKNSIFVSKYHWGWGAGLYGLLVEAIVCFRERFHFCHFMSIDYDTLFIKPGADQSVLDQITSSRIGLVGHYNSRNIHWETIFKIEKERIEAALGKIPRSYRQGEGVQGGCFVMTDTLLRVMKERGMFGDAFRDIKKHTKIADDHLVTLFARMCGLEIMQINEDFHIRWSLERDPLRFDIEETKVFHPTKIRSSGTRDVEVQVRNFYRERRGRGSLKR